MRRAPCLAALTLIASSPTLAQHVTSPQQQFGHEIGADYVLPNYRELTEYWKKLDRESDRMRLVSIGKTAEGRDQLMAIVSSPRNMRRLDHYRDISRRLAIGDGLTDEAARKLAKEGKAIVWIDGGLHANEVLGAQQLMETLYQMVSRNDEETRRILDDCIILFVHANPDGMDLVSDWYMRRSDPKKRTLDALPRLYQKYAGHDNNRDFYAVTQPETKNMNRVMYREWFPQIMYNHHQTGPRGAVLFCPPFRPPFNHHVDPLVMAGVDLVGMAMHSRFIEENKPGAVTRAGASYSAWWNGGLRTTAYFHNIIGILTETIGSPTPMEIPFVPERQVMTGDLLFPVPPQEWRFRQSIDYSVTANRAILDLASRRKENFLFGAYRMAKSSVERGRKDTWTNYPSRVEKVVAIAGRDGKKAQEMLHAPELRDARAYVLPADQPDFPTAVKFANTLIENGVAVHRTTGPWSLNGRAYPAGSLVVRCDQPFRPHILDMFEPQDHPNDIPAPGAPPTPPYDNAGYTLAFQMGVKFDRILDAFEAPLEPVKDVITPSADVPVVGRGWMRISALQNDSYAALAEVLKVGESAVRVGDEFWFPMRARTAQILGRAAKDRGVKVTYGDEPSGPAETLTAPRIALFDRYGGSMPSGWTRYIFDNWGIDYKVVFPQELDAGDLRSKYDVLVLPSGTWNERLGAARDDNMPDDLPAELRPTWGRISAEKTLPQVRKFLDEGGTVIAVGGSTALAMQLGLPIESALVDEDGKPLRREKYYVPGSILQARVDNTLPVALGMPDHADFTFDESPVFRFKAGAEAAGLKKIAWFDTDKPLRSGWAWGQKYLKDGIAAAEAPVGKGKLYLFGPEITFRGQPHGTFRLLFNGLFLRG
jgi:hypothetical protein